MRFINKKGSAIDVIVWIVVSFITVMFLALWVFMHNTITTAFVSIPSTPGSNINVSQAAVDTFGAVNQVLIPNLHILAFVIMFAMVISIFVSNFLVKSHPVFFVIYVFMTVIGIILAAYVSNTYETLLANGTFGLTLGGFAGATYIMLYLPIWATVIGLGGAIFLFVGIIRERDGGGI